MATEKWNQESANQEAAQTEQSKLSFSVEEVELACDAPVTVYGRMQP